MFALCCSNFFLGFPHCCSVALPLFYFSNKNAVMFAVGTFFPPARPLCLGETENRKWITLVAKWAALQHMYGCERTKAIVRFIAERCRLLLHLFLVPSAFHRCLRSFVFPFACFFFSVFAIFSHFATKFVCMHCIVYFSFLVLASKTICVSHTRMRLRSCIPAKWRKEHQNRLEWMDCIAAYSEAKTIRNEHANQCVRIHLVLVYCVPFFLSSLSSCIVLAAARTQ